MPDLQHQSAAPTPEPAPEASPPASDPSMELQDTMGNAGVGEFVFEDGEGMEFDPGELSILEAAAAEVDAGSSSFDSAAPAPIGGAGPVNLVGLVQDATAPADPRNVQATPGPTGGSITLQNADAQEQGAKPVSVGGSAHGRHIDDSRGTQDEASLGTTAGAGKTSFSVEGKYTVFWSQPIEDKAKNRWKINYVQVLTASLGAGRSVGGGGDAFGESPDAYDPRRDPEVADLDVFAPDGSPNFALKGSVEWSQTEQGTYVFDDKASAEAFRKSPKRGAHAFGSTDDRDAIGQAALDMEAGESWENGSTVKVGAGGSATFLGTIQAGATFEGKDGDSLKITKKDDGKVEAIYSDVHGLGGSAQLSTLQTGMSYGEEHSWGEVYKMVFDLADPVQLDALEELVLAARSGSVDADHLERQGVSVTRSEISMSSEQDTAMFLGLKYGHKSTVKHDVVYTPEGDKLEVDVGSEQTTMGSNYKDMLVGLYNAGGSPLLAVPGIVRSLIQGGLLGDLEDDTEARLVAAIDWLEGKLKMVDELLNPVSHFMTLVREILPPEAFAKLLAHLPEDTLFDSFATDHLVRATEKNDEETTYEFASRVEATDALDTARELSSVTGGPVSTVDMDDDDKASGTYILSATMDSEHVEQVMDDIRRTPMSQMDDRVPGFWAYLSVGGLTRTGEMIGYLEDFKEDLVEAGGDSDARRAALAEFISETGKAGTRLFSAGSGAEYEVELVGDKYLTGSGGRKILEAQIAALSSEVAGAVADEGADLLALDQQLSELDAYLGAKLAHVGDGSNYPELPDAVRRAELGRTQALIDDVSVLREQVTRLKRRRSVASERDRGLAAETTSEFTYDRTLSADWHDGLVEEPGGLLGMELRDLDDQHALDWMEVEEDVYDRHAGELEREAEEFELSQSGIRGPSTSLKTGQKLGMVQGMAADAEREAGKMRKRLEAHRAIQLHKGDGFDSVMGWVEDHESDFFGDWTSESGYADAARDYDRAVSDMRRARKQQARALDLRALSSSTQTDVEAEIQAYTMAFAWYKEAMSDLQDAISFYDDIRRRYDWAPPVRYRY